MSNTLVTLAPVLYSAAREVANEPFGIVSAINADFDDKQVAKGDSVDVPVAPARTASDFTPSNITSTGADAAATDISVQITKSRKVDWHLTGEQQRSLENGGINQEWVRQLVAQGMRTLRNECEVDAGIAGFEGAASAVGVGGTTPFASNLNLIAAARKALQDRGAPLADLQMCIDTAAGLNLRQLNVFQQANLAGSDEERRSGRISRQFGFMISESAGVASHTTGGAFGASPDYLVDRSAGYDAGDTTIHLDTGSGSHLAGDVISFAGDTNKYVIGTGAADNGDKDIVLRGSGLRQSLADNVVAETEDSYTANLAFERSAIVGVMRPPLMPANPTIQPMLVSDQYGMTYLMLDIAQYGQRSWELHLAWGFKAVNPDFITLVMG
jgi:hypothetical protein